MALCLRPSFKEEIVLETQDGIIKISYQKDHKGIKRLYFDAPKSVKILRVDAVKEPQMLEQAS